MIWASLWRTRLGWIRNYINTKSTWECKAVWQSDASCTSSAIFGRALTAAHRHKPDNSQTLFLVTKWLTELIISNSWPAAGDICHFNRRRRRPSKNEKLFSGFFPLCFFFFFNKRQILSELVVNFAKSGVRTVNHIQTVPLPAVCACAICPFSPPVLCSSAQVCNILIAQWAAPGVEEVLKTLPVSCGLLASWVRTAGLHCSRPVI